MNETSRPSKQLMHLLCCAVIILTLSGCSTFSMHDALHEAEPKRKALFLALYPELSIEQRRELLTSGESPYTLIRDWKVGSSTLVSEPERFAPRKLVVETQAITPVKNGRTLPVRAFLDYPNRKREDVTQDVHWSSAPDLAWNAAPGVLDYECLAGEVEVHADFFGELAGSLRIPFNKKIRSIEIGLAEPSQVIDSGEYLQLQMIAYCEDGTRSAVTCQASWTVDKTQADLSGCGSLHIVSREILSEGAVTVKGSYAGKEVTRLVHFGVRKR